MGTVSVIYKASMDGTMVTRIHSDSTLVWAEFDDDEEQSTIITMNYSAQDLKSIEKVQGKVQGLTVMGDIIYWTDGWKIFESDKSSQVRGIKARREIADFGGRYHSVFDMLLIHSSVQPRTRPNYCAGKSCSDICVLNTNYFKCLGPDRLQVTSDGYTCAGTEGKGLVQNVGLGNCGNSYTCSNGDCLDYEFVCGGIVKCADCSDEGPGKLQN